ncbi:MAG TPA: class I tRNA ligase family protein, partial [Candidatus Saccharimonadales bacterium]
MNLPKTYTPQEYETNIYALWESSGAFRPSGEGEPYSVVMPPPNANGNLHIGHALTVSLEDILTRYHRMLGRDTIYIPGADHAGFETWVVYERALEKEGKSRFDFSREQLYSQVWNFVEEQRGGMELQLRALGASASWEHLVFTLDKKVIDTVYDTFQKLWDDGLVYRGERIVNYCTKHQTSFSDIEVEHSLEKGKLWKIAYPLLDRIGEIVVATTRPETMLGDVAVAVHPEDDRY